MRAGSPPSRVQGGEGDGSGEDQSDAAHDPRRREPSRLPPHHRGGCSRAAGSLAAPKRARAQTPKKGGTLVYGMEGPSDILDPQATGCWLTYRVTYQLEGLLAEDLTRADVAIPPVVPRLAESYTVAKDGLSAPSSCARASPRRHPAHRPGRGLLVGTYVQRWTRCMGKARQQLYLVRGRVHHRRGSDRRAHAC